MSLLAIKNNLKTALEAMQTLKAVYDYEAPNSSGSYPYATLTIMEGDAEYRSTAHNLRRRRLRIRVYQEMTKIGQGSQSAESIALSVVDELEAHLDLNTTLSGACKYAVPVAWEAQYIDREVDTRVLQMDVDAMDLTTASA